MGIFDFIGGWFGNLSADLPGKTFAEFKSRVTQYLTEDDMLSKKGREGIMDKLQKEGGWSKEDIGKANECIQAFKDLKKGMVDKASGEKRYDFIFINEKATEETALDKYEKLSNDLVLLQKASTRSVFKDTTQTVISLLRKFSNVCTGAVNELDEFDKKDFNKKDLDEKYKKILSNLNRQEIGAATKVSELFKRYIYQKSIMSAADVAKFYFAACSISSKKDQQIGFLGRGISNTLLYTQDRMKKKYDELLQKATANEEEAAAAAAAAAAEGEG